MITVQLSLRAELVFSRHFEVRRRTMPKQKEKERPSNKTHLHEVGSQEEEMPGKNCSCGQKVSIKNDLGAKLLEAVIRIYLKCHLNKEKYRNLFILSGVKYTAMLIELHNVQMDPFPQFFLTIQLARSSCKNEILLVFPESRLKIARRHPCMHKKQKKMKS